MRKLLVSCCLGLLLGLPLFFAPSSARAAASTASSTPASAHAASAPVQLTPQQAREALDVLNNPQRRGQIETTLRAIAAAGALAAPAPASAASGASAADAANAASTPAASGAAALVPEAFKSNGLATQLARQGAHWAMRIASALRKSGHSLLDTSSARAWWAQQARDPHVVLNVLGALAMALIPAIILEWLARRLLRRWHEGIAARRDKAEAERDARDKANDEANDEANVDANVEAVRATAQPVEPPPPSVEHGFSTPPRGQRAAADPHDDAATVPDAAAPAGSANASATASTTVSTTASTTTAANAKATEARGRQSAARHRTLLERLPRTGLSLILRILPLAVFVIVASVLMSIVTDDDTPANTAISGLIDVYVVCRAIVIGSGFFLQPNAPRLRLLHMTDVWARFTHHWVVRIVATVGIGVAIARIAHALGMNDTSHLASLKLIALIAHVMIAIMVLQCRRPVANWIRERMSHRASLSMLGDWVADMWAIIAAFVVMALWFIWALDVENGYATLMHHGGLSIVVLVAARVVSIIVFGGLARIFEREEDDDKRTLVHRHAYRYYPLLRRTVTLLIGIATVFALLGVWGLDVTAFFSGGSVGHRLLSAVITIAIAAFIALIVWESVNVTVEKRLELWTSSGDMVRAARLRTLLPMMRTALFVAIALIVVLTGLSELGVNIGPLLAGASIFGVALGFGSQKLVQDFITGIFLLMENAMQVGDWVTMAGVSGTVEYLSIRTVRLRAGDGSLHIVPFSSVSTVNNTNRGLGNAAVKVIVAYDADIDGAIATLKEIGAALREDEKFKDGILGDFSFWGVDAVDGSGITLAGQIQCRDTSRWGVQREFNRRIFDEFNRRGIPILNPLRTLVVTQDARLGAEDTSAAGPTQPETAQVTDAVADSLADKHIDDNTDTEQPRKGQPPVTPSA